MELSVIGINCHTAPVDVRERFALPGEMARRLLGMIHRESAFQEALVLDTCNRTEVYLVAESLDDPTGYLMGCLGRIKGQRPGELAGLYRYDGAETVGHLFRVAAGLDSQIIGESQILGQLKRAYRLALQERTARFVLNKLLHRAFAAGKRVRSETALGAGSVSVAQSAAQLARESVGDLADKTALLIGAGETAVLAARALVRYGVRRVIVANRTVQRAREVGENLKHRPAGEKRIEADRPGDQTIRCPARLRSGHAGPPEPVVDPFDSLAIEAAGLDEIPSVLGRADVVLSCTAAPQPVLTADGAGGAIERAGRSVCIIDIAVPRDVDERLGQLPSVWLYNIDDLKGLVDRNLARRREAIPAAEAIAAEQRDAFMNWLDSRQAAPTIKLLRRRLDQMRAAQIERYGGRFDDSHRRELQQFARGLCNKILHGPMDFLRERSPGDAPDDRMAAIEIIRRMFDLDSMERGE